MDIKLIAADVDGTLVNGKKKVTPAVATALAAAKAKGVYVTLATGRPIQGLTQFLPLLSFEDDIPLVTYNGAVVLTAKSRRVLRARTLGREAALALMARGFTLGVTVVAWCRENLYIGMPGEQSADYANKSGVTARMLTDPAQLAAWGVTKLIWVAAPSRIAQLEPEYRAAPEPGVYACTSEPRYLEFMAEGVSKAAGLAAVAEALGIKPGEIMALGDGDNDADMLRFAGLGVAMGNAPAAIRAQADDVTDTNEADGLAKALAKWVLS